MNENIKAGSDIHAGDGGYSIGTKEKYDEFVKGRNQSLGKMRIKEFEKQCWSHRVDGVLVDGHLHFDSQKFAELIVRECAGLFPNVYIEIETEYGHTPVIASDYIKKHFGVEE
jgi:hypothetical protein